MRPFKNSAVEEKFNGYPDEIKSSILLLRELIFGASKADTSNIELEECLKWNEPSYCCKTGSTIRLDWKSKDSENLHIYFNCKSKLIETFREIYGNELTFSGNRVVLVPINEKAPERVLTHCFSMAFNYHKIKHLPMLGA